MKDGQFYVNTAQGLLFASSKIAGWSARRLSEKIGGIPPPPNIWIHRVSRKFPAKSGFQRT
jgi:hypothetical protein